MLRNKLLYAVLVAGLACFYVLYIDDLPLVLLITALAVPVFLKIGLLWLHFSSDVSLECTSNSCTSGVQIPVTILLHSHCPLWFPGGIAKIRVTHGFGADREILRIRFPVQSRTASRLTFYLTAERCGIVTAELLHVHVFDVFRLLYTNIRRKEQKISLLVLPKPIEIPLDSSAPPVEDPESDRFADKPGDDPSELFGIREYQPGDPVTRIHWKLSSRSEKLWLKEFGAPIDKHTLLLAEYCPPTDHSGSLLDAGALLTVLYSIAFRLTALHHPCTMAWYNAEKDEVMRYSVQDEASLAEAFHALFSSLHVLGNDDAALRYALGTEQFSSAVLATNLPETQMLSVLEHSVTANHRTAVIISNASAGLHSDATELLTVSPEDPVIDRLIV